MSLTVAQLLVKIGADVSQAQQGMASVSQRLQNVGKTAALTGGMLTLGVTLPLVAVAKQAISTAVDYQSSMNMFQAVSGATADQMAKVNQKAIELGADMSLPATSAADAGQAMTELAKAGLSVNDSMAAAKGVLQLSAAGNLDNAQAAEIAADALNAFHLAGSKATDVANLLAAAANASSGEVTDMADAMKMGAAVFASAGQPIDSLVTAISEMANAGIKGQDAGTSLKQMLLALEAPTSKAQKLMESLGIDIYDAQGKMLPFRDIISQFSTKLGGMTQQQRDAALATIFGSDAVRAANVVLMGGVNAYDQMHTAVTKQNAAADLAAARMKGLGGAFEGLKSQIETVLLQGMQPFMGTLEGIVRSVADFIPKITEVNPQILAAAGAFLAVVAAAGPVIVVVGAIATGLAFLLSPVGLVVLAVALLAAAWATDFGGIREITASVVGFIVPLLTSVVAWFVANWPVARQAAVDAFRTIQTVIQTIIGFVSPFVVKEMGVVTTWWNANLPTMQKIVQAVFSAIQAVIAFVMPYVQKVIQTVMPLIEANWRVSWAAIQAALQLAWGLIQTIVDLAIHNVLDLITIVMDLLTGNWQGAWDAVQDILKNEWEAMKTIVNLALVFLRDGIVNPILNELGTNWTDAWNGIQTTLSNVWNGIMSTVKNGVNTVITDLNKLIGAYDAIHLHISGFSIGLPSTTVAGHTVGGGTLSWPGFDEGVAQVATIPLLDTGGIVTSPTLAMLAGNSKPEAVIPLDRMGSQIDYDKLAEAIAKAQAKRPTYQINATYPYQSERSLRDDVRMLQALGAHV